MTDDLIKRAREALDGRTWYDDARFIAAARDLVPAIDRIEALTAEVERLREAKPIAVKVKPMMWTCAPRHYPHEYQARCELTGDYYYASSDEEKMRREAVRAAHILSALDVQPGFTAEDLRRAWEAGRDAAADENDCGGCKAFGHCMDPTNCWHDAANDVRALTPPADLADKVKEGRADG